MARRRRNRLLIPESGPSLDRFKTEVMSEALGTGIRHPEDVKTEVARRLNIPLKKGGNGDLKAEEAGKIGGAIGGRMVKEMVRMAEQALLQKETSRDFDKL
jgi:hypothetical protein